MSFKALLLAVLILFPDGSGGGSQSGSSTNWGSDGGRYTTGVERNANGSVDVTAAGFPPPGSGVKLVVAFLDANGDEIEGSGGAASGGNSASTCVMPPAGATHMLVGVSSWSPNRGVMTAWAV